MVIKMKNSCKLIRKNSYEVHKHQDRYQEILESLYDDLDINPVPSESRLRQPTPTCEYKAVPEFLALRLKKAIDKAKDSIFAIFYDVPLQIDMSAFRRNVAQQHRLQVASICEIISVTDLQQLYFKAASSITAINALRSVFNHVSNEEFLFYYQLILKLQIPVQNLLLEFFIIKEFKERKQNWQGEDQELVSQIEGEFTKKTFYYVVKQYLHQEGLKLEQEICRICEQPIKIEVIQEHIEICQKEHEAKYVLRCWEKECLGLLDEIRDDNFKGLGIYAKILEVFDKIVFNGQIVFDVMRGDCFGECKSIIKEIYKKHSDNELLQRFKTTLLKILTDISLSQSSQILSDNPCINILPPLSPLLSFKTLQNTKKRKPTDNRFSDKMLQFMDSDNSNEADSRKHLSIRPDFQESVKCLLIPEARENSQCSAHYLNVNFGHNEDHRRRNKSFNGERSESDNDNSSMVSATMTERKIGFKDFKVIKFLGKGAFGKVYLVQRRLTKDLYAMKTIQLSNDSNKGRLQDLITEHQIFKKIGGQHLVKASFSFTEGGVHFFFLQYMEGGDLAELLQKEVYFTQDIAKFYIAEIVLAIEHLHTFSIIHRDLKPGNIVLDENGHLKLTDFGLSFDTAEAKNPELPRVVGTPDYMPPEILTNSDATKSVADWWSLGVIIYEVLVGIRPFGGQTVQEVFENILAHTIEWPEIGYSQGMMTPQGKDLIERFLQTDPSKRLGSNGTQQIKSHPFFSGVNWFSIKHDQSKFQQQSRPKIKTQQDQQITQQIERLIQTQVHNVHFRGLDDLVRFDILSQATIKSSEKVKRKNSRRLTQINQLSQRLEKHFA